MNILINYANDAYRKVQKWNSWSGRHIAGFDKVIEYSDADIDQAFRLQNSKILSIKRGNGLWLWKPYFVNRALEEAKQGDIVVYCDSGSLWIGRMTKILKCLEEQDIWITSLPFIEKQWTKRECFDLLGCSDSKYKETNQCQAGFLAFRKNEKTQNFVKEWLKFACDYRCIGPSESEDVDEDPIFKAHREDQSILSLLAKKKRLHIFQDPTQYGKYPEQYSEASDIFMRYEKKHDYSPFIILHRQTQFKPEVFFRILIFILCPEWLGHHLMHRDFGNILK